MFLGLIYSGFGKWVSANNNNGVVLGFQLSGMVFVESAGGFGSSVLMGCWEL